MLSPYRRNVLVGAVVVVAGVILIWMILKFSSKTAEVFAPPQIPVHFVSARADGLSDGSGIFYLGVSVGRVTAVERRSDNTGVMIDGQVDRNPPLPGNVQADITQHGLLGSGADIDLELVGNRPAGELSANSTLNARYIGLQLNLIPPAFSETATSITQMSDEIRKLAEQLRTSNAVPDLDQTIRNVNEQVTRITDRLDKLTDDLRHTSNQATQTLTEVQRQIGDRMVQIAGLLNNVQDITRKINQGKGTAGELINDPKMYEALTDTARELSETVADLKRLIEQWEQEGVTLRLH